MIYNVFFTILLWSGRIYIWIFKKMKSIVVVYLLCLLYFMIKIHTYYSHQNMSEKLNFPLDVTFKNIFLFRKYEKCKMQKIIFKFYHCNFIRISKVVIIWLCNINYKWKHETDTPWTPLSTSFCVDNSFLWWAFC